VSAGGLTSWLSDLTPGQSPLALPGVARIDGASPLGDSSHVPYLHYPAAPGTTVWTLVGLTRARAPEQGAQLVIRDNIVAVTWPDGVITNLPLATVESLDLPWLSFWWSEGVGLARWLVGAARRSRLAGWAKPAVRFLRARSRSLAYVRLRRSSHDSTKWAS
jgi:hypothetical protein